MLPLAVLFVSFLLKVSKKVTFHPFSVKKVVAFIYDALIASASQCLGLPDWHYHHLLGIQKHRTNPVIHLEVSIKCQRFEVFSNLFVLLFLLPCLESEYFVKCFIPVSCKTNTSVVKIDVRFHLSQFRTLWLIGIVVDVIEIDIILA